MATRTAEKRLRRDFQDLIRTPPPKVRAAFHPSNILVWHFIFVGEKESPFEGGYYLGLIKFGHEFPFKPPAYKMQTANGRFAVNEHICTSNSSYHIENWTPLWTVGGLLNGLVSFFHDLRERRFAGAHRVQTEVEYRKYAADSKVELLRVLNQTADLKTLFLDIVQQVQSELNGAQPQHRLPFPPEHVEWLKNEGLMKRIKNAEATEQPDDSEPHSPVKH